VQLTRRPARRAGVTGRIVMYGTAMPEKTAVIRPIVKPVSTIPAKFAVATPTRFAATVRAATQVSIVKHVWKGIAFPATAILICFAVIISHVMTQTICNAAAMVTEQRVKMIASYVVKTNAAI